MRLVGIVLVALGAIVLGMHGFGSFARDRPADPEQDAVVEARDQEWVPAVMGGIAVTGGLLVLATDGRRE
jgi:hypothetical protein